MRGCSMPCAWRRRALAAALCNTLFWPATVWPQPLGLPTLHGPAPIHGQIAAPVREAAAPLTLDEAWTLALSASPRLAAAAFELQAQDGSVQQAGVLPNPVVEMSIEDTQTRATRTRTVQLNQLIELGGKRSARVGAAERGREVAAAELEMARLDLRATVRLAFVDVLLAQERLRLSEEAHAVARRAAETVARRVTAGKVSPVERTRAGVEEASARVEVSQARGELTAARQRLAAAWGGREPRFTRAEGRLSLPEPPSAEALAARMQASPVLSRARLEVQRRQALAEVERSRRMPDLTVSVGSKRAEDLGRSQTLLGVSIPLPLFDRNQGNVLEALRRADKARSEQLATETDLAAALAQACESLNTARLEAETLRREVLPGARSAYQAASKGYELGKFAYLDVLDAQRTYFQTQFQHLRALAQAHRAAAEIERVLGAGEAGAVEQKRSQAWKAN